MLSLSEFAGRLKGVKWSGDSKLTALCPAHDDGSQSLSATLGNDGRTLAKCFTGCDFQSIVSAMGLTMADVLPDRDKPQAVPPPARKTTTWKILDADGALVAEHIRLDEGGKKSFVWRRNGKHNLDGLPVADVPLYRSEVVPKSKGTVILVEGEKSADAAAKLGLVAVGTTCGAATSPGPKALEVLRGRDVVLWPDNDAAGREHMERIAKALTDVAKSVRWLKIPDAPAKADAADYRGTKEALRAFIRDEARGPIVQFATQIKGALEELDRLHMGDRSRFVTTGLVELDNRLGGGFRRGQVTLIGAPPGAGKTTLVVHFAMACEDAGLAVIVSPEMSPEELVTREIVRRSGKPKWMRAQWSASEHQRETAAMAHNLAVSQLIKNPPNVAFYDAATVTLDDVHEHVRAAAKREVLSIIALDYAQQLADEDDKRPRYLQVGDVGVKALEMAREFDCHVVITSQVNTFKVGKEKEYAFRESSNLEQKANNAMLFIVERDEHGHVKEAFFRATKVRDNALFKLSVNFHPATFRLEDEQAQARPVETREWVK